MYDDDDENDWPEDDEPDFDSMCVNCGVLDCSDGCGCCGGNLCHYCGETGGGFCRGCTRDPNFVKRMQELTH